MRSRANRKFGVNIRIANSLFLEKFSLIRVRKFPVPLHREFGWKALNSLADWASKSQAEGRIQQNSLLISLLAGISCGDWFAADCIVSQPVRSQWAMSAWQQSASLRVALAKLVKSLRQRSAHPRRSLLVPWHAPSAD